MEPMIIFDNVSKKFSKRYVSDSLRDGVVAPFKWLFSRISSNPAEPSQPTKRVKLDAEFWALNGVSFEVKPGEPLGIIGPNGSGKSTVLKLLSRILRPDGGRIMVKGRVGALIELAAGFHPDLTGRENVFLNASILGMNRNEIAKKYDEIVDFAELHEFMDTPVKWYSSGMHARLGFATAAYTDPSVLLIDEVLSVGDIGFQQKCENKIRSIKEKGLTIVFVSHNMSAISAVCDKVLVLAKGKVQFLGSPQEAVNIYTDMLRYGHDVSEKGITLIEAAISDISGTRKSVFEPGEQCRVLLRFRAEADLQSINIGVRVRKKGDPNLVFAGNFSALTGERLSLWNGQELRITFGLSLNLVPGHYSVGTAVRDVKNCPILRREFDDIIIKDTVKVDGIAFLNLSIASLSTE